MKRVFEFFLICLFTFAGELLNIIVPLPIPGSVWGLVMLFIALYLKIIKLEQVEMTAQFLIQVMPIMFVPILVSVSSSIGLISQHLMQVLLTIVISTIVVFLATTFAVSAVKKTLSDRDDRA